MLTNHLYAGIISWQRSVISTLSFLVSSSRPPVMIWQFNDRASNYTTRELIRREKIVVKLVGFPPLNYSKAA